MQRTTNANQSLEGLQMKYQFKTEPWKHQRNILAASFKMEYAALLMEYGTGKTWVVLNNVGVLWETQDPRPIDALFVIAPNGVHEQWVIEQIPEHFPDRIPIISRVWTGENTLKFRKSLEDFWNKRYDNHLKVFTINVEALQTKGRATSFAINFLQSFRSFLVVDESTRIKNHTASRTKFIMDKLGPLAVYRRTLTGNEITRSPFDVYCPYEFLKSGFWKGIPNYFIFTHKFGEYKKNFIHKKSIKVDNFKCPRCEDNPDKVLFKKANDRMFALCPECRGTLKEEELPTKARKLLVNEAKFEYPTLLRYKNLDDLRERTTYCSFLARKEECMDLPEKIYQPIYTEMNPEQEKLYRDLKEELKMEYDGIEITVTVKIALSIRFQQIIGGFYPESEKPIGDKNPKIEALLYDLEDITTNDPIIVWARFRPELQHLAKRLKKEYNGQVELYYGDTSREERLRIREDFRDGKVQFLVANQGVAGTGLNLQRSYMHYYFSNSFVAEDRWQSEDRSHRGGQKHNCLYKDIFIKGSIDDTLKASNQQKKDFAEFFKEKPLINLV